MRKRDPSPAKSEGHGAKPSQPRQKAKDRMRKMMVRPGEKRSAAKKSPVTGSDRTLLEVTTRFELVNDGFAGRYPSIQKALFFLGFLTVDSEITIAITIFRLV